MMPLLLQVSATGGFSLTADQQFYLFIIGVIAFFIMDHFQIWDRIFGRFMAPDDRGIILIPPEPPAWLHNNDTGEVRLIRGFIPGFDDGEVWDSTLILGGIDGSPDEQLPVDSDKVWQIFKIVDLNKKEMHLFYSNKGIKNVMLATNADLKKEISKLNIENKTGKKRLDSKSEDIRDQYTKLHEERGKDYRAPTPRGHRQDGQDTDDQDRGDQGKGFRD